MSAPLCSATATSAVIAAIQKALVGLEPLSDSQAADYINTHPYLTAGVAYVPKPLTAAMIAEIRAIS